MDLQNVLPHMRGKGVRVNGTSYALDDQGVAKGVSQEDAAKLLQNRDAWRVYVVRSPSKGVPPKANLAAAAKPPPVVKPSPVEATPPPVPVEEIEGEEAEPEEAGSDDWPDPEETMDIEYLRQIADAYDVQYTPRTGKKRLVTDIMQAMYPDK